MSIPSPPRQIAHRSLRHAAVSFRCQKASYVDASHLCCSLAIHASYATHSYAQHTPEWMGMCALLWNGAATSQDMKRVHMELKSRRSKSENRQARGMYPRGHHRSAVFCVVASR